MKQAARDLLSTAGLKRTPGRVAMLGVLLHARQPLTPREILVRVADTGINRVSVYRGLHAFSRVGIVHRVRVGDGQWRFAVCKHEKHATHCHPHFTCRSCGKVECLGAVALRRISEPSPGYRVEEQEVYMRGICANCSEGR